MTNICCAAIENPRISLEIGLYVPATQRKSVRSDIRKREVKERLKLHVQHIHHVAIRSELKYLIEAKAARTGKLEPQSGSYQAQNPLFYVPSG
jgi:hypothetical protein